MPERPLNERMYRLVLLSVLALAILAGCAQPPRKHALACLSCRRMPQPPLRNPLSLDSAAAFPGAA